MTDDVLEEVDATVRVLIREEMDVRHRLGGHPTPAQGCPMCRHRARPAGAAGLNRRGGRP